MDIDLLLLPNRIAIKMTSNTSTVLENSKSAKKVKGSNVIDGNVYPQTSTEMSSKAWSNENGITMHRIWSLSGNVQWTSQNEKPSRRRHSKSCNFRFMLILVLAFHLGIAHGRNRGKTINALRPEQERHIGHFIRTLLYCKNIPGVAITAVTRGKVLLQRGYGVADVNTKEKVTADTVFPIASNTKAFTATLLAILLDEINGTDWDTPIKRILGAGFELYNDVLTEQISLRDLLAHRTGVPDYFLPLMAVYPEDETRKKMVWRLRYHKPIYPFRSKFRYNNYMYMLAGYVAEVLGKASWEDLVRKRIFEPLGMKASTFIRDLKDWDELAPSYAELPNGTLHPVDKVLIRQVHVADPAGSILSTMRDMSKWLQLHLRKGQLPNGRTLIAPKLLKETYREEMPSPSPMADRDLLRPTYPVEDVHLAYDMGWMTNVYRGYKRIWHSGGLTTYKSQAWFYPELDLGLAVVCSGPPKGATSWALIHILQYLTDQFTGHKPWMNATTGCSFPEPWKKPKSASATTVPSAPEEEQVNPTPTSTSTATGSSNGLADDPLPANVDEMTGIFSHPGFGDLNFTLRHTDDAPAVGAATTGNGGWGTNRNRRLHMRMGRYLEAALLYNKTARTFYTQLTGRYWYSTTLNVPVRFAATARTKIPSTSGETATSTVGQIDTVFMPLNSPWAETERFAFVKGGGASELHHRRGMRRELCITSSSSQTTFSPIQSAIYSFLQLYCLIFLSLSNTCSVFDPLKRYL